MDTTKKYISDFIDAKLAMGRQESTIEYYRNQLDQFAPFVDEWPPTISHIRAFLLHKRKTCNEVSVNTAFKAVQSFLNWCEFERLLTHNPVYKTDRSSRHQPLPKPATQEAMARFIHVIESYAHDGDRFAIRDLALFRLAYDTGCRASELSQMELDDLDLHYGSVFVRNAKGQKDRVVYFAQKATEALMDWLVIHPECEWLFPNRYRARPQPLGRRGMLHAVKKWSSLAKIRKMTVHRIRHSYATHSLRRGIDLGHIQHQLGHSDIKTTAIYLAIEDSDRRRAHRENSPGDAI
jgi:integrase/recombinase XerD